jgi:hypothetical protein
VNFDPDTRIRQVRSYFFKNGGAYQRAIDISDAKPDTVPLYSWVWLQYQSWDDTRDDIRCSPLNYDRCIDFQVRYDRVSERIPGSFGTSGWLPRSGYHDSDTLSAVDSNSVNIGSVEYTFYARGIDENDRPDGTPARVEIVGNYDPTLESVSLFDHLGNEVDISPGTTGIVTWNFWKGIGWPYSSLQDTVDFAGGGDYVKRFGWRLEADGFDHPDELDGSGIKAWRYLIFDDDGNFYPLARAGETWVDGDGLNHLDDTFEATFHYPSYFTGSDDPCGETVFENLPDYVDRDLTVMLTGRDTAVDEGEFSQYVFLAEVPPGAKGLHGQSEKFLINRYPTAIFGRYTEERSFTFRIRMIRDPECPASTEAARPLEKELETTSR